MSTERLAPRRHSRVTEDAVLGVVFPHPIFFGIFFLESCHHLLSREGRRAGLFGRSFIQDSDNEDEENKRQDDFCNEAEAGHAYLPLGRFAPEVLFRRAPNRRGAFWLGRRVLKDSHLGATVYRQPPRHSYEWKALFRHWGDVVESDGRREEDYRKGEVRWREGKIFGVVIRGSEHLASVLRVSDAPKRKGSAVE